MRYNEEGIQNRFFQTGCSITLNLILSRMEDRVHGDGIVKSPHWAKMSERTLLMVPKLLARLKPMRCVVGCCVPIKTNLKEEDSLSAR